MNTPTPPGAGRDHFLERVRQAVVAGNQAGSAAPLPERGGVGYQGAGPDAVASFARAWNAAGGQLHRVADRRAAVERLVELVRSRSARRVLLDEAAEAFGLSERLAALGMETNLAASLTGDAREQLFAADVGISGTDYLVAETGSLALRFRPDEPRSLSLLPPVHIVVADVSQILPDLFDLFERLDHLPSCLSLITGPSKTGDIELRLVTGVHGPGEVHVVLITGRVEADEAR